MNMKEKSPLDVTQSPIVTEMEKPYKIAQAKLGPWKISTQNICKKC